MISVEQAQELETALNAYGDAERIFGMYDQQKRPQDEIDKANVRANKALDAVAALLRPHIAEPDHPALNERFAAQDAADPEPDDHIWLDAQRY